MSFTLRIFKSEFEQINDFVQAYPNIETGGDLFGLWKANGDPVVQLIIGPGQKCRRTSVSFHQDTDYLARVGTYVNSSFMLCHIGSWHSHHQLSLTQPSAGDRTTVCNNFPQGLERYIMIIANISRGSSVHIHPYMFSSGGHVCRLGNVKIIPASSPFRENPYVVSIMAKGAEKSISGAARSERAPVEYYKRPSTRSKPITGATPGRGYEHPMRQNYMSADDPTPMDVGPPYYQGTGVPNYKHTGAPNYKHTGTRDYHMDVDQHDSYQETQWYETEEGGTILKETHLKIENEMADRGINYNRHSISRDLTMEFIHNNQRWTVKFPKAFTSEPAQVESSGVRTFSSKNIIKDIRRACSCIKCKNYEKIDQQHSSIGCHPRGPGQRHGKLSPSHTKQDNYFSQAKQNPGRGQNSSPSPSKSAHRISPLTQAGGKRPVSSKVQGQQSRREASSYSPAKASPRKQSASQRPVSRYGVNIKPGSSRRVPPSPEQVFFKNAEKGEKKFKEICRNFRNLLLKGEPVSIERNTISKEVIVTFTHNKKLWRITFPFTFPVMPPTLEYAVHTKYKTKPQFSKVRVPMDSSLLSAVRQNCKPNCSSCSRYGR